MLRSYSYSGCYRGCRGARYQTTVGQLFVRRTYLHRRARTWKSIATSALAFFEGSVFTSPAPSLPRRRASPLSSRRRGWLMVSRPGHPVWSGLPLTTAATQHRNSYLQDIVISPHVDASVASQHECKVMGCCGGSIAHVTETA